MDSRTISDVLNKTFGGQNARAENPDMACINVTSVSQKQLDALSKEGIEVFIKRSGAGLRINAAGKE